MSRGRIRKIGLYLVLVFLLVLGGYTLANAQSGAGNGAPALPKIQAIEVAQLDVAPLDDDLPALEPLEFPTLDELPELDELADDAFPDFLDSPVGDDLPELPALGDEALPELPQMAEEEEAPTEAEVVEVPEAAPRTKEEPVELAEESETAPEAQTEAVVVEVEVPELPQMVAEEEAQSVEMPALPSLKEEAAPSEVDMFNAAVDPALVVEEELQQAPVEDEVDSLLADMLQEEKEDPSLVIDFDLLPQDEAEGETEVVEANAQEVSENETAPQEVVAQENDKPQPAEAETQKADAVAPKKEWAARDKDRIAQTVETPAILPNPLTEPERSKSYDFQTKTPDFIELADHSADKENAHIPRAKLEEEYYRYAHAAALRGNVDGLRALLDRGISPNAIVHEGKTLLMFAALAGQEAIAELLLVRGANTELMDFEGNTALHHAAYMGRFDVAKQLLHFGANPRALNAKQYTALDIARGRGYIHVAQMIEDAAVAAIAAAEPVEIDGDYVEFPEAPPVSPQVLERMWTNIVEFYDSVPVMPPFHTLTPEQKVLWTQRLDDWIEADRQFDRLSFEQKVQYSYRRRLLEQLFPSHFKPNNAIDQLFLADYMKRWDAFEKQVRLSRMRELAYNAPMVGEYTGIGVDLSVTRPRLLIEEAIVRPDVAGKPPYYAEEAPLYPSSAPIKQLELARDTSELTKQKLLTLLENWRMVDGRFGYMTVEQKIQANYQRRKILDMLVADSGMGTYAFAFASLPGYMVTDFIDSLEKWDDFEDWLRLHKPEMASVLPPWGALAPDSAAEVLTGQAPDYKEIPASMRANYPTHDRTKYRLLRSNYQYQQQTSGEFNPARLRSNGSW